MVATPLTERQKAVLGFITDFYRQHKYSPTVREIASNFGITSLNGVKCHLKALESKGVIHVQPKISRGIVPAAAFGRTRCPHCKKWHEVKLT